MDRLIPHLIPVPGRDLFVNKVYSYTQTDLNVTSTVGTNVTITNLVTPNTGQHGKILIGGGFSSFNGVSRNGIARLNTSSTWTTFNPGFGVNPGMLPQSAVQDLAVQPDGKGDDCWQLHDGGQSSDHPRGPSECGRELRYHV